MLHDLRLGLRRILHARGFSTCVLLILGAGIGTAATMFSVLNALAFKSIAVADPQSLVAITSVDREGSRRPTPLVAVDHLRKADLPAEGWCGYTWTIEPTESGGRVMDAHGEVMSGDCPKAIGFAPALGRWFESAEAPITGSGRPVIVITHKFWLRMFDGNPDVLGRSVRIQNTATQVIGVMPEDFAGFSPDYATDFLIPFNAHRPASGAAYFIGRLKAGASVEQLDAAVRSLWPAVLEAVLPTSPTRAQQLAELSGSAEPFAAGTSVLRRLYATPVRNMTILSAALILLVCVNVGGLLLARVSGRTAEITSMRALGASPLRLARPLLAESVIYAAGGAAVGVPLAYAGSAAFTRLLPWANIPWSIQLTPDSRILAGSVGAVLVIGIGISLLPVWLATRRTSLQHHERTTARATNRWTQGLLVAQVVLTVVLVFTGGLVVRSFNALWSTDRGFRNDGLLSLRLVPNPGGYDKFDQPPYYSSLVERLAGLPGVQSVGFARYFGTINTSLPPQPVAFVESPDATSTGVMEYISPRFFETAGIPLISGRDVTWSDLPSTVPVAVVSESLARSLAPDGAVVGRLIRFGTSASTAKLQIVGVVGNISLGNFRQTDVRIVYTPSVQAGQATFATVQLRTAGDPLALARPATEIVAGLGREHVQRAVRVDFLFTNSVVAERMAAVTGTIAAILALVISSVGLFALLSHSVQKRTREIGIRMAVGASPAAVSKLVIGDALMLVLIGLAIGLPSAVAATSLVRSLLFGVTTTDGFTLAASAALLLVTAMIGAAHPAIRAMKVEPTTALRAE